MSWSWAWPTSFILISSHHWYQHPRHYFHVMTTSWSPPLSQHASSAYHGLWVGAQKSTKKTTSKFHWWWREREIPRSLLMKATRRLLLGQRLIQILVVVAWEEYPRLLLMKATDGSHSEWWAERLAGRSISPTFEDVNISFNHPPYYSMSRGVTAK